MDKKAMMQARHDRLAHEIQMMVNDAEHWNRVHPTLRPIDADALAAEPRAILAGLAEKLGLSHG